VAIIDKLAATTAAATTDKRAATIDKPAATIDKPATTDKLAATIVRADDVDDVTDATVEMRKAAANGPRGAAHRAIKSPAAKPTSARPPTIFCAAIHIVMATRARRSNRAATSAATSAATIVAAASARHDLLSRTLAATAADRASSVATFPTRKSALASPPSRGAPTMDSRRRPLLWRPICRSTRPTTIRIR
jgi:hypothetical protein